MVGLPAFQGVLGEEVQTHRTHHLPRALQTVCNFNILFDNNFLHLCHHPLSKFDTFAWCRQLPKNSETAQKGQKAVICSLNLQLRPLQSDSSCPIFCRKTPAIYANIFEKSHIMQIYLKMSQIMQYIWKRQKFMHIYFKTSTQSLLNRSTLKSIFRASQDFPRNLHLRPKHLKASSYSNVGVLLKCDILWKSLRNIAQRAFWLLGKLDSQPLPTNKGHRKNQK